MMVNPRYRPTGIEISQAEDRNAYMREYRRVRPNYDNADKSRGRARNRALRRLGQMYPRDLQRLIDEELRYE
jgi:hypothetical protein